nr:CbiX/SirB N-terminal domain-containing protein [Nakamurella flavida]
MAHGSRDPRAAETIEAVMAAVAELRPGLVTRPAYLDLMEPDLGQAVVALQQEGELARAVVLPLLFTQAFHATVDTPTAVGEVTGETGVELLVGDILGMGDEVLAALRAAARTADVPDDAAILLLAVGSSVQSANDAVHDLAGRWAALRTGPVWAGFATAGQPKAAAVLEQVGEHAVTTDTPVVVVPLFLAPGLLLDATVRRARDLAGDVPVLITEPLGTTLAGLVLARYDAVAG